MMETRGDGWLKLYEEILTTLREKCFPVWRGFGFSIQSSGADDKLKVTLGYNGREVDSLTVRIEKYFGYPNGVEVMWDDGKMFFAFETTSRREFSTLLRELDSFTRILVLKAAGMEVLERLRQHLVLKKDSFKLEAGENIYFDFYFTGGKWIWGAYSRVWDSVWIKRGEIARPIDDNPIEAFVDFFQATLLEVTL